MSITITRTPGGSTISPFMVLGYEYQRVSSNVVHEIMGAPDPEVTAGPLGTREATLTFLATSAAGASALDAFHDAVATFALVDTAQTIGNISYVIAEGGAVHVTQTDDRAFWIVAIDVREI